MEGPEAVEPSHLLYLYCICKGGSSVSLEEGIEAGARVFGLPYRDLCALVSYVPAASYGQTVLRERVEDPQWLVPRVARHDEIVREVMRTYPVIPMRFGSLYASEKGVLRLLRSGYEPLCSFFEAVRDKEEWGLKVYVRRKAMPRQDGAFGTLLESQNGESAEVGSGLAYLQHKKRVDLLEKETERLLASLADQVYARGLSRSAEGRRNRLLSRKATGRDQEMILNAAFLVRREGVAPFKQALERLAEGGGLLLEFSGPWPPYNFCPDLETAPEGRGT